jgi:hypothetical protein
MVKGHLQKVIPVDACLNQRADPFRVDGIKLGSGAA